MFQFKKWLEDQEQADNGLFLLESLYLENDNSLFREFIKKIKKSSFKNITIQDITIFIELIKKIDNIVGVKKFLKMVPETIYAYINFLGSVVNFSKVIHKPSEWKNQREEIIANFAKAFKLGLASGLIIPASFLLPGSVELNAILAKIVSYGYFYMSNWIEKMIDDPKYGEIAQELSQYFICKNN